MLSRITSAGARRRAQQSLRQFATVEKSTGAIGSDGRHEIWRGDVDHDNEPKVSNSRFDTSFLLI
jgi:DNA-binding transcriptional regulator/RsmH inhibitor MraZ